MEKNTSNEPENKQQITRLVQIALITDQTNALAFVPSNVLHEFPLLEQMDVIELRLVIDRLGTGVRIL